MFLLAALWLMQRCTSTVCSEKYTKFFRINVFCTQVHSQCMWCSVQVCNSFKTKLATIRGSLFVAETKSQINFLLNPSIHQWITKRNLFRSSFPSIWDIKWAICFICSSFYCFLLTHWYTFRINITNLFLTFSFEI